MKLPRRILLILLIPIGLLTSQIGPARAASVTLSDFKASYTFAESITFSVSVSSDTAIQQASLFFQSGGTAPVRQTANPFTSAT
ncbi:MAG TPA: hypothetical protein VFK30_15345, partial [Anaerolineae bacterium]|nr:hypothetical protein [Anaerolineae bacterium]